MAFWEISCLLVIIYQMGAFIRTAEFTTGCARIRSKPRVYHAGHKQLDKLHHSLIGPGITSPIHTGDK